MEQKQLDEIDESFIGEEIIEEDFIDLTTPTVDSSDTSTTANVKSFAKPKKAAKKKATKKKTAQKKTTKKVETTKAETKAKSVKVEAAKATAAKTISIEKATTASTKTEKASAGEEKSQWGPWEEEEESNGSSSWKIVAALALLVLLAAIFTNGFGFLGQDATAVDQQPGQEVLDTVEISGQVVQRSLLAKRWLFSPKMIEVEQGDTVRLSIEAQDLDFTFTIEELGVAEQVSGQAIVEFVALEAGEFTYRCQECEAWRGMRGTLVVR